VLEKLDGSAGRNLGYRISGDVTREDYDVLRPQTEAAINDFGSVNLLCDLTAFKWEKIGAWKADLEFGHEFRKKIDKLAIVGDHRYERLIADVAHPLYANESKYFTDLDEAWAWFDE
jgi:hypothetical protein